MVQLYSERVLTSPSSDELYKWTSELRKPVTFIFLLLSKEKQVKCLGLFEETMRKGYVLLAALETFFFGGLPSLDEGVSPTKGELLDGLRKTIDSLQIEEDRQTFAFRSLSIEKIYDKYIVLKRKFEFFGDDSSTWSPTQKGRLFYDLILPFNNKKPKTGRCFKKEELPKFYRHPNV